MGLGLTHLGCYQGSAGSEATFYTIYGRGGPYPPTCVYFYPLVCWLKTLVVLRIVPLENSLG